MSDTAPIHNDIDEYIAALGEEERQELAHADAALDLAILLYRLRTERALTQKDAAEKAGLKQQAISRWERSHPNIQLSTLQRYLDALGYNLELVVRDAKTGQVVNTVGLMSGESGALHDDSPNPHSPSQETPDANETAPAASR
jgi:transcriptional regulator with XRE-family HTH domain